MPERSCSCRRVNDQPAACAAKRNEERLSRHLGLAVKYGESTLDARNVGELEIRLAALLAHPRRQRVPVHVVAVAWSSSMSKHLGEATLHAAGGRLHCDSVRVQRR